MIVKSPAFLPITESILGKGVVWAEGENHRKQRRLVAPAFRFVAAFTKSELSTQRFVSTEAVKDMADEIAQCAAKVYIMNLV